MTYSFSLPGLLMTRRAQAAGRATRAGRAVLLVLLLALPLLGRAQSSSNVVTLNASAITTVSATLGCHINNPGSLTTQGVAYALGSVTPLLTGNSVSSSVTPGVDVYYSVSNLLPGRHYSMRAFSIDSQGNVEYGPFNGFDTPPLAYQPQGPVVTVTPAASTLSPGGTQTLTASTTLPGFGLAGAGLNGEVFAVQVQPDGKVLVGGNFTSLNDRAAPAYLLRLNADGTLDTGFSPGQNGLNGKVYSLVLQPDGKVVVGGEFTAPRSRVLRVNADGSLDPAFNPGGAGANDFVRILALQPDGKVLVGGLFTTYNGSAVAPRYLMRVNPDGSLETTLTATAAAVDGLAYTWSTGATGPTLTVSQPGNYVVKVTTAQQGIGYSTVVRVSAPPATAVRLTPPGPLALPAGGSATLTATATQPGFDVGGSGFNNDVQAVLVQPDGKVLVGGLFTTYNGNANAPDYLVRLLPDGTLDPTFNPGGTGASGGGGPVSGGVYALALQPDGKVLVGGRFDAYNGDNNAPNFLLRVNANGTLDTGFNYGPTTGFVHPRVDNNGVVYALALQPDGKVLAGGRFEVFNGSSCPHHVARVNADGSLDINFNFNGSGIWDDAYNSDGLGRVEALLLLPNGKIMVGGVFSHYDDDYQAPNSLLRLYPEGDIDRQFNYNQQNSSGGYDGSGFGGQYDGAAGKKGGVYALALQPDGKVLVGGAFNSWLISQTQTQPFSNVNNLMRLNTDNTVDGTFNTQLHSTGTNAGAFALALQPDGRVLVGGAFTSYNGTARNYLMRIEANGTLNHADFNFLGGPDSFVRALALQPDGKVLVGGLFTKFNGSSVSSRLIRLQPDGTLNNADAPLAGATVVFNPGNVSGSTYTVRTPGTYTATATDPATGFAYPSNAVTVTFAPLPVELMAFTATLAGPAAVHLAWATASEKNSQAFIVERSLDGQSFAAIGTVAAAGSSTSARRYELSDAHLPAGAALLYYRLRQVDLDGTFSYSPVRTVALTGAATGLALFPNPAQGGAVTLTGAEAGTAVTVLDALGRPVLSAAADAAGTAALALPAGLAAGVYVVRVGSKALRLTVE